MTDTISADRRKELMSAVKAKNSQVELLVFRYLRHHNVYFQKHYRRAPGSPDLALPRKKKAVFVDGDFWHGRKLAYCIEKYGEDGFWTKKVRANIERDKRQGNELKQQGWTILRIWESDLKRKRTRDDTLANIASFLTEDKDKSS